MSENYDQGPVESNRGGPRPNSGRKRFTDAERVESEARRRALNVALGKERRATANSIGKIPECKNPKRREKAEKHLRAWIETYLISRFRNSRTGEHYPWGRSQTDLLDMLNDALHQQSRSAAAVPRGTIKSGAGKAACMFGVLKGIQQWSCLVGATSDTARKKTLASIKIVLETTPLLLEDYPEAIYPIAQLDRSSQRAGNQTYTLNGVEVPTYVEWGKDRIIFPNVQGSKSRQAIITAIGLTASDVRGQVMSMADGSERRPSFFFFDDIETRESASSELQVPGRIELIKDALGSGGPGTPVSAFLAGTVIEEPCAISRILEMDDWDGIKRPAMIKMPLHCPETAPEIEHEDIWGGEYHDLFKIKPVSEMRKRLNVYYRKRREIMDLGGQCDWEGIKDPWEISGIQHCMNIYLSDPAFFWSELQQAPRRPEQSGGRVTSDLILSRTSGYARRQVPSETVAISCGIDVHQEILFYVICAWAADFTGVVIDYGTYPDQGRPYFLQSKPPHPLRLDYIGKSLDSEGIMQAGIESLLSDLRKREFQIANGSGRTMQIGKYLVDGGWGDKLVYSALRRSGLGSSADISKGRSESANTVPIASIPEESQWGKRIKGLEWFVEPPHSRGDRPLTYVGVNFWKSFVHRAFAMLPGTRGSLQLFGTPRESYRHELLSVHVANSEAPVQFKDNHGNVRWMWKKIPGGAESHYLDAMVYAAAGASRTGNCHPPVVARDLAECLNPIRRPVASPTRPVRGYDSIYS